MKQLFLFFIIVILLQVSGFAAEAGKFSDASGSLDSKKAKRPAKWKMQRLWRERLEKGFTEVKVKSLFGKPKYVAKSSNKIIYYYQNVPRVTIDSRYAYRNNISWPTAGYVVFTNSLLATKENGDYRIISSGKPKWQENSKKFFRPKYIVTSWIEPDWNKLESESPSASFITEKVAEDKSIKWRQEKNWKRLVHNMPESKVWALLGEPDRKTFETKGSSSTNRSYSRSSTRFTQNFVRGFSNSQASYYGRARFCGSLLFYYDKSIRKYRLDYWSEPFWPGIDVDVDKIIADEKSKMIAERNRRDANRRIEDIARRSKAQGSGFLLSEAGLAVTNNHVIIGRDDITVRFLENKKNFSAKVVFRDAANDIAILSIEKFKYDDIFKTAIPYKIETSGEVNLAEKVYTLGVPLGELLGESVKFSTGTISSLFGLKNESVFQISNPIQPGSSGGPLFNENGDVIGIVVASLNAGAVFKYTGSLPQNINFAIKSDQLRKLISKSPENLNILKRKGVLKDKQVQEQVKSIIPFIISIHAKKTKEQSQDFMMPRRRQ